MSIRMSVRRKTRKTRRTGKTRSGIIRSPHRSRSKAKSDRSKSISNKDCKTVQFDIMFTLALTTGRRWEDTRWPDEYILVFLGWTHSAPRLSWPK